ncbi:hypothetical protein JCM15519_10630 [Fundidesulfovibrio butyratiphilus]
MDLYRADLHVHSRYSRATSKGLTPRNLAAWARVKGIDVVATGDFTHPAWLSELSETLVEDGQGLYRLKDPKGLEAEIPWLDGCPVPGDSKFILSAEISSIYKRDGKVRKVHNLVYMPSFEAVLKLNAKLERVGNLQSDGRPILGLDSRHLLEMVLETDPLAFLVPAHIWTPWFSLFGSKSGFDSIEECFGPLSNEIFALETGLSSDPEMNWLLSSLDRFRLISNSDAHSGEKLGREANLFSGPASYEGIYRALRGEGVGHDFLGTVEFFPEEGKYHLDGHRACSVVLDPQETKAKGGLCPVCGKPLTIGVLHRVMDLADRQEPKHPPGRPGFVSLVPLSEVLGELHQAGPATKKVRAHMAKLLARLGPEMHILSDAPLEDLSADSPLLAEAISRMRQGRVFRRPGFDGEYGRISVFAPGELTRLSRGVGLAPPPDRAAQPARAKSRPEATGHNAPGGAPSGTDPADPDPEPASPPASAPALNPAQARAATAASAHTLVLAGPGTGKTHTLVARIRSLVENGAAPGSVLVVTFTRRAAQELRERLGALPVTADTLHALAYDSWTEAYGEKPVLLSEDAASRLFAQANPELTGAQRKQAWRDLGLDRECLRRPREQGGSYHAAQAPPGTTPAPSSAADPAREAAARYARQKASWNLVDYTDLLEFWLEKIESGVPEIPFQHVLVDEAQDLSPLQLAIVRALVGAHGRSLFAIGDPKQSIYAFRGAVSHVERTLTDFWPDLAVVSLAENYRSTQAILDLAHGVFPDSPSLLATRQGPAGEIVEFTAPSALREVSWMAEKIRALLGPTSATLAGTRPGAGLSPGDVAVLVRFKGLMGPIRKALTQFGVPCSVPEAEAFWADARVQAILNAAGRFLGLTDREGALPLTCPDQVLARGPKEIALHLRDIQPFDRLFWQSREFAQLCDVYAAQGGWPGLLSFVNGQTELELVGRRAEKVRIMTLHASKGLEFEAVFLPALEDGILPFAGAGLLTGTPSPGETPPDEREEERLFYVGLTRAKSRLYLSHARKRELYGRQLTLKPSRLLKKLDLAGATRSHMVAKTVRKETQLGLLG